MSEVDKRVHCGNCRWFNGDDVLGGLRDECAWPLPELPASLTSSNAIFTIHERRKMAPEEGKFCKTWEAT